MVSFKNGIIWECYYVMVVLFGNGLVQEWFYLRMVSSGNGTGYLRMVFDLRLVLFENGLVWNGIV